MNRIEENKVHTTAFDVASIRKDFPILHQEIYNHRQLVYFDNAASSQRPVQVIRCIDNYYRSYHANVHRGVHYLSQKASVAYDAARVKVKDFIHASSENEIIFTRGTTESINLVAATFARLRLNEGDEVLISAMEHHSNIVPWQMVCAERKALLKIIPMNDAGELVLENLDALISTRTKLLSITYVSNSLGTINPVKQIIETAHRHNVPVMIDGAQAVAHLPVDVQDLDCDFFACSGHKMLGPTGIGFLYGKTKHLEAMPPYMGGGEMISRVTFEKTTYNEVPYKFEAGTPHIEGVIALGAAIDYWNTLDRKLVAGYENQLLKYATEKLSEIKEVRLIGTAKEKAGVLSFILNGINALDAGMYLDTQGIAVRTGHHCTEPVMDRLGIPGTIRASFMFYNTVEEIDLFIEGVRKAIKLLA